MKKKYRMSRGGRLALNLVLLCVLVVFIWGLLGFYPPLCGEDSAGSPRPTGRTRWRSRVCFRVTASAGCWPPDRIR